MYSNIIIAISLCTTRKSVNIIHSHCIVVDLELPLNDRELWRYGDKIAHIWKRVGLELGLKSSAINAIELNHPHHNENAALAMLIKWKEAKSNPPRRILHQAIENCKTQAIRGMYIAAYLLCSV